MEIFQIRFKLFKFDYDYSNSIPVFQNASRIVQLAVARSGGHGDPPLRRGEAGTVTQHQSVGTTDILPSSVDELFYGVDGVKEAGRLNSGS